MIGRSDGSRAWLTCVGCGATYPLETRFAGCQECKSGDHTGGLLEVRYAYDFPAHEFFSETSEPGIWRFRQLLPLPPRGHAVSLGEGATPLVQSKRHAGLWFKNESVNPTWSFKDRFNSVNVSMAVQFAFRELVSLTTGNGGMSVAAYAAAAGLGSTVLYRRGTPNSIVNALKAYGADVATGEPEENVSRFRELVGEGMFPSVTISPHEIPATPFGLEGYKSISFEIVDERKRGGLKLPQAVFCPVGGGDCLYGIYKGFRELVDIGLCDTIPRLFGVQAQATAPLVRAFEEGSEKVTPVVANQTVATSINESYAGDHALDAVYSTRGRALAVTEAEIQQAQFELAGQGMLVEAASAAAYAGYLKALQEKDIDERDAVVCVLTGSGIKWLEDGI